MKKPKQVLHEHHKKNDDGTFSSLEDTTLILNANDIERKFRNLLRQKVLLESGVDLLQEQIDDIIDIIGYSPQEPEEEDYSLETNNGGE